MDAGSTRLDADTSHGGIPSVTLPVPLREMLGEAGLPSAQQLRCPNDQTSGDGVLR